jgi:hypothetical protein
MWTRRRAVRLALAVVGSGVAALGSGCPAQRPPVRPGPVEADKRRRWSPPEQTAQLFQPGTRHLLDNGEWATAATHAAGVLQLPTGRLIAADPSWLPSWQRLSIAPYTATVPAGRFPVTLALVEWPTDRRVAAAKLTIRDEPVVAWEMALRPGESLAALRDGAAYTVGVDVATIALFDAVALPAMARRADEDPKSHYVGAADRPIELTDPASGANLIAFETGWGDGAYPVWIGRTPAGAVACFVVDMAMLESPVGGSPS